MIAAGGREKKRAFRPPTAWEEKRPPRGEGLLAGAPGSMNTSVIRGSQRLYGKADRCQGLALCLWGVPHSGTPQSCTAPSCRPNANSRPSGEKLRRELILGSKKVGSRPPLRRALSVASCVQLAPSQTLI